LLFILPTITLLTRHLANFLQKQNLRVHHRLTMATEFHIFIHVTDILFSSPVQLMSAINASNFCSSCTGVHSVICSTDYMFDYNKKLFLSWQKLANSCANNKFPVFSSTRRLTDDC